MPLERFPDVFSDPPRFEWQDIEGNGHLSLVVVSAGAAGVFYNRNDGDWSGFRPFAEFPPEARG